MKQFFKSMLAIMAAFLCGYQANATGWPANYQGVMLQGFYWDSYDDTAWANLESQADELSQYFTLIWVPNSAKAATNPGMGYDPVYWFTNHNTKFGTEAQLRSMIKAYKAKGVGIIADVVINHRSGVSNWTNFPTEQWNGQTWKIGLDGICRDDEVNQQSGQAHGTGAADTGEGYGSSRDLDHTNANVQANCKAYVNFLLNDLGYAGVRYDYCKGYDPKYTKMYNQANNVRFSVGEYWDGSYDALADWINGTGKESAAFDFAFKYAVNKAFSSGNMSELVWKANGTTDQPAGLIHFGYPQYAVTFIDNHDTYRDGNKFTGNVPAANAFMICSPGTPCVFLPHYKGYKKEIQAMIAVRNACGITNTSSVRVLKAASNCYMAEVTGAKGKLVVKIGSAMESPSGYTNSDIKASGKDYCIWSKVGVNPNPNPDPDPDPTPGDGVTVYWDNTAKGWATPHVHYWGNTESDWPGVAMTKYKGNIWKYTCPEGTTGCIFNAGDGDASKTDDFTAVNNHVYTAAGDQGEYSDNPNPNPNPTTVTIKGDYNLAYSGTKEKVYFWPVESPAWPGAKMSEAKGSDGKTYKVYKVPEGTTGVIFATTGDSDKTGDLTYTGEYVMNDGGATATKVVFENGDNPGPDPQPGKNLYLVGKFNDWAEADANYKFTYANGVYTLAMTALDGEFKIMGDTWKTANFGGQGDPGATVAEPVDAVIGENTLWSGSDCNLVADNFTEVTLSFAWDGTAASGILTITKGISSITDIEAAEAEAVYYNLQGVRVAEPTSGIYIKVAAGKATKVAF